MDIDTIHEPLSPGLPLGVTVVPKLEGRALSSINSCVGLYWGSAVAAAWRLALEDGDDHGDGGYGGSAGAAGGIGAPQEGSAGGRRQNDGRSRSSMRVTSRSSRRSARTHEYSDSATATYAARPCVKQQRGDEAAGPPTLDTHLQDEQPGQPPAQ